MKGFTLIEILIVLVIFGLLVLFTVPLGAQFLKTAHFLASIDEVVGTLRNARDRSLSQDRDSAFGVYVTPTTHTLFKGNSFLTRDPLFDEVHELPAGVSASGLSEVVFAKYTGMPNVTGNIVLTSDVGARTISINSAGRIAQVP